MFIDEKFKDCSPEETVSKIKTILNELDIECCENWNDSGVNSCHSVNLKTTMGVPNTNGKGISKDFARASAYAEFIERLESGLFLSKYRSIIRDPEMDFHAYAPDGKYMTVNELIENGEWMDYIVNSYNDPAITRETIAKNCKAYACADDGKILTVPFYSLFEDKYVCLPIEFVSHMYTANGNCAGNTREEAWVHALSEIMERNASRNMIMSGKSYPVISEEVLNKFPKVREILKELRENGDYDVTVMDCSLGNGFPVIATRIVNKNDQSYLVNVGADPILEIAVQRTFTELFQGRTIKKLRSGHKCKILNNVTDFPVICNVLNHTQTSDGLYTADYFTNEITCERTATNFKDMSNKNNKELLTYMLGLYKEMGTPVYVRNFSFLGFHSYKFVVPGFSETRSVCLNEKIPEFALADDASKILKDITKASNAELHFLMIYYDKIKPISLVNNNFCVNVGIPLTSDVNFILSVITRAYAHYRLGNYKKAIGELSLAYNSTTEENANYFRCINMYLQLLDDGVDSEKIKVILYKFFKKEYPDRLYSKLEAGLSPYDDYLLKCDLKSCDSCNYKENCRYDYLKGINAKLGEKYKAFVNGQDPTEFKI